MNNAEAATLATQLIESFPQKVEIRQGTFDVYAKAFRPYPLTLAQRIVQELIDTVDWIPPISEVKRRLALKLLPNILTTEAAWDTAVSLMARIGSYGSLGTRGNPYVNHTLRLCGRWAEICQEDATWLRKRFVEIYESVTHEAVRTMVTDRCAPDWLFELTSDADRLRLGWTATRMLTNGAAS